MARNNIDWQTGMDKLVQVTSFVLNSSWRTDVKFDVGPDGQSRIFKGHKLIMAMRSPVFEAMFFGDMPEKDDAIRIPDVCPNTFQALLEYIYTDEVNIDNFDSALNMCYVANKYMFPGIFKKCTEIICRDVSALNACEAFQFAILFSDQELEDKCYTLFVKETEAVLGSKCFLNASPETLLTILSLDRMKISSEKIVAEATLAWGRHQCQLQGIVPITAANVRKELTEANVIFQVRYLTMTMEDFMASVAMSDIFTDEEVFAIMKNISVPGSKAMPLSLKDLPLNLKPRNVTMLNSGVSLLGTHPKDLPLNLKPCNMTDIWNCRGLELFDPSWANMHAHSYAQHVCRTTVLIHITVNQDIFFHGILFVGKRCPSLQEFYIERVRLRLFDNDYLMVDTKLKQCMNMDDIGEMILPTSIIIRKERSYKMNIAFSSGTKGYYPKKKLRNEYTKTDDLKFTLYSSDGYVVAVHSILFS